MELRNSGWNVPPCGSEKPLIAWGRIGIGKKGNSSGISMCVRSGPAVRHLVGNWKCGSGARER